MVKYTWNRCEVPDNLKVRQVYGVAFSEDGRILLRIEDGKYKLTGGRPEDGESYEETLKREFIEEVNIELDEIYYLGYLLVEENDERYAQVRMIGRISEINNKCVDVDTGKIYERFLVNTQNVKGYLNYEEAGNLLLDDAIDMAYKKYKFVKKIEEENYI